MKASAAAHRALWWCCVGLLVAVPSAAWSKPHAGSAAQSSEVVTYRDLLDALQNTTDEEELLKRLEGSPTIFTLSSAQQKELQEAGASEAVLEAIRKKQQQFAIDPGTEISDLAIILDCSGSMSEMAGGETKMEAARPVVIKLLQDLPHGMNVTFIIYGHDKKMGCDAVKVVRPLEALDGAGKEELIGLIENLQPVGGTPITLALRQAGKQLEGGRGPCGIVLVTDGMDTCPKHGKPEDEAARLAKNPKLNLLHGVTVVGFGLKPMEKAKVKKIADASRGDWYDADSPEALVEAGETIAKAQKRLKQPKSNRVSSGARRIVRILEPEIQLPAMKDVQLFHAGEAGFRFVMPPPRAKATVYGKDMNLASDKPHEIWWFPVEGKGVLMVKEITAEPGQSVEIKPEDYLGMIRVLSADRGPAKEITIGPGGSFNNAVQTVKKVIQSGAKYDVDMVVPAGSYDVWVTWAEDGETELLQESLEVQAGERYEIE